MSSRSPRGSLSGASSAEVAEDFGDSLKDLQINNRYEINNLMIIAKENTEHAQAISKALETHINTTAPNKKLPALYVLDSIVKNVGTPYTVYLGRDLYRTFMNAYTLVDGTTRRNMEGMLKTWKEPVPGSLDTRPVFPIETTRPIENALIKAKTAAMQTTRTMPGQVQQQANFRNTPTPPGYPSRFPPPPDQMSPQQFQGYQQAPYQGQPGQGYPQPGLPQSTLAHYPLAHSSFQNDIEAVKREVTSLISQRQAQFGANPYDPRLQKELKDLLDLQSYLTSEQHSLNPAALQQIRETVGGLANSGFAQQRPTPQPATPQWQPPTAFPPAVQQQYSTPPVSSSQPPSVRPHASAPLFAPGALDGLQALLANGQKPSTPQLRTAAPALQNASHAQLNTLQNHTATAPNLNGADLIASLTKSGLLSSLQQSQPTPPTNAAGAPPSSQQSTSALLQSLQGLLPPTSQTGTPTLPTPNLANTSKPRIPMTAAALKTFRPELVTALYEGQPNQCTTCGRRFLSTDTGRENKARHLDWHFRTNQRIADPSINRGAHRDWYPTEMDWIQLKEFDPSTTTAAEASTNAAGGAGGSNFSSPSKKSLRPEDRFIRAPPGVTRNTCSICFEEMKSSYSEELQDWVFTNAVAHEGRIVHATCLADMQKGSRGGASGGGSLGAALAGAAGQRQRSATPDSSLGKRKAEGVLAGGGSRLRVD